MIIHRSPGSYYFSITIKLSTRIIKKVIFLAHLGRYYMASHKKDDPNPNRYVTKNTNYRFEINLV